MPMKIDSHQHYWHYQPQAFPWIAEHMQVLRQDLLPAHSRPAMAACGVDAAVAVQARSAPDETDFLLGLAAHDPQIVGVVGWVDLAAPGLAAQLDLWAGQRALRGFRHLLQDEPDLAVGVCRWWLYPPGPGPVLNSGTRQVRGADESRLRPPSARVDHMRAKFA
jgi:L-fuconolactonase